MTDSKALTTEEYATCKSRITERRVGRTDAVALTAVASITSVTFAGAIVSIAEALLIAEMPGNAKLSKVPKVVAFVDALSTAGINSLTRSMALSKMLAFAALSIALTAVRRTTLQ